MKKADKKVKEYLERATKVGQKHFNWNWDTRTRKKRIIYHKYILEIAKMIQREEIILREKDNIQKNKKRKPKKIKKQLAAWLQ